MVDYRGRIVGWGTAVCCAASLVLAVLIQVLTPNPQVVSEIEIGAIEDAIAVQVQWSVVGATQIRTTGYSLVVYGSMPVPIGQIALLRRWSNGAASISWAGDPRSYRVYAAEELDPSMGNR